MDTLQINSLEQVPHGINMLFKRIEQLEAKINCQPAPQPITDLQTLLTRQQAAEALKVSLPTLNELTKTGKVKGYRIGNRLRYKASEINEALTSIKASNIRIK